MINAQAMPNKDSITGINNVKLVRGSSYIDILTPSQADALADELHKAAEAARKVPKKWEEAPVGSFGLVGTYVSVVIRKSHDDVWLYESSNSPVKEHTLAESFRLLKVVEDD